MKPDKPFVERTSVYTLIQILLFIFYKYRSTWIQTIAKTTIFKELKKKIGIEEKRNRLLNQLMILNSIRVINHEMWYRKWNFNTWCEKTSIHRNEFRIDAKISRTVCDFIIYPIVLGSPTVSSSFLFSCVCYVVAVDVYTMCVFFLLTWTKFVRFLYTVLFWFYLDMSLKLEYRGTTIPANLKCCYVFRFNPSQYVCSIHNNC